MSEHRCPGCGSTYTVGSIADGDAFTHVSVSQHHQDAPDFAVSTCPSCAADLVDELWALKQAKDPVEGTRFDHHEDPDGGDE